MLQLNSDQTLALQDIKRRQDLRALRLGLAEAFPDVAARAGERFEALVAHGVERGQMFGLSHGVCLARYLACWFMLGAEFEARADHAWARSILGDLQRPQGSRIFQLCRRVREVLAAAVPGQTAGPAAGQAANFDAAIARLDAVLMPRGDLGSLLPASPLRLGQACDIDALDLQWRGPAVKRYRVEQGQWQQVAGAVPEPLRVEPAMPAPKRLHVLGRPVAEREQASLRMRIRQAHRCDAVTHPLLVHVGSAGFSEWRGSNAEEVQLPLYADAGPDGIGVQGSPAIARISAAACGLRDAGPAFGSQDIELAVYPASQQLLVWRREPGAAAPRRARHERDGNPLSAERWQAGLADLDRQLEAGLARLASAWERDSGVSHGHMDAEPAVLVGTAGVTWGWNPGTALDQPPRYRLAGMLDLVACRLQLRLAGDFQLYGAHSRLALHCSAAELLNLNFESRAEDSDPMAALERAQTRFRQPFALQVEALAGEHPAALLDLAGPLAGAVTGACGLRVRSDGPGLEWFLELAIEPVSVRCVVSDPLLGSMSAVRTLLPAIKLVQWSLG